MNFKLPMKVYPVLLCILLFSAASVSELRTSSGGNRNYNNSQTTYVGECYSYIRTLVEEGKEDSSLGLIKSMHRICTKNVDLNKVQQTFGDSKSFADFLTKNKYQNLGEKNYFDSTKCSSEKQTPIHEISSKYYYMLTRVKLGQESLVAQVAAINRVLGDQSILDKMGCVQSNFPEVKKVCDEAKNCTALNKPLEKLEKQTQDALSQIAIIEKEIQTREINIRHPRTSVQNRTKYKTELNWLQIQLQTQQSLIPWAEGDVFKKTIKSKRPVGEAIQKQLEEDRRVLVRTFADSEKMKRCITGNPQRNDRCSTADIVEMAKYTPPVPSVYNFSKDKDQQTRAKFALANMEADSQQCLFEGKVDQIKTSDVINESMLQAGLTVATLGLGSAASVGRLLTSRALMAEKTAANLVKASNATRLGVDGGLFLKDSKEAIDICQKYAVQESKETAKDSCQIESIMDGASQSQSYSDCMLAVTFAGLNGGRLALGQLRKVLSEKKVVQLNEESQKKLDKFFTAYQSGDKTATLKAASELDELARFKAAEAILNKPLSLDQKRALLKAHEVGGAKGFYEYTESELREKMKILVAAGIPATKANEIMRQGVAGKFSKENAKLAEDGLLDGQMKERNTYENLKSYEDDYKHQSFQRKELDKKYNENLKEIELVERKMKDPKISPDDLKNYETKLSQLQQKRSEVYKSLTEGSDSVGDHITDARASVVRTTDEIDRIRFNAYEKTGKSLSTPNLRLQDRLDRRRGLFEREAFLEAQKNSGDPSASISAFRRATKDLNEIQSMGFTPKTTHEAIRNIKLRAVSQDLRGITNAEVDKLIAGKTSVIERGAPILTGEFNPSKSLPVMGKGLKDEEVWNAYVNYSQRKADHFIVKDLIDDSKFLKTSGIDPKKADSIEEAYMEAKEKAEKALRAAIEKKYKTSPGSAKDAINSLLEW